jgi:signal transduction histidine kinase
MTASAGSDAGANAQDQETAGGVALTIQSWRRRTESYALWARLALGAGMLSVYLIAPKPIDVASATTLTLSLIVLYIGFAIIRIALHAARRFERPATVISPVLDFALLGFLVDSYQRIYSGGPALSLHSPTFGFFLVFIALHGMRLDWRHSLFAGLCAMSSWAALFAFGLARGGDAILTHEYSEYVAGGKILVGAEVERLIALAVMTAAVSFTAHRAQLLSVKLMKIGADAERAKTAAERDFLLRAKAAADRESELKSQFLAKMSHELRTPLNGVLGFADILDAEISDSALKQRIEIIRSSGQSLLSLINQILEASRLNSRDAAISNEPFNLRRLVHGVADEFEPKARAKGLAWRVLLDGDFPRDAIGDGPRLFMAVAAVLDNAVKFTESGEVSIAGRREMSPDRGVIAVMEIRDTGVGFPQSDHERIFNLFEQADNSTTRKFDGAGLGLSISRRIIEAMGGSITPKSSPGAGSVFTIRLPVRGDNALQTTPEAGPGAQSAA